MFWVVVALAVGVTAGWLLARRQGGERAEAAMSKPAPPRGAGPLDTRTMLRRAFHSDEYVVPEDAVKQDRALMAEALRLLADHVGAKDAVLWNYEPSGGGHLTPEAWAPGTEPPALPEAERLLIELSAETLAITFNTSGALRVMATGVRRDSHIRVISVHFREEPLLERASLEEWLQRHALSIVSRHEVLGFVASLSERNARLRSAVRTAATLQGSRDPEALERLIGDNASEMTGGTWTCVVRWDALQGFGRIVVRSEGAPPMSDTLRATPASLVGRVCAGLESFKLIANAKPMIAAEDPLFDDTPPPSGTRALIVAPLRRATNVAPIGAVVIAKTDDEPFSTADAHAASALGTLGAGALETAWAMRDEAERALTDQLTGLPNRRAFEADFARFVAETDRYGGGSALVLADVDHFKLVNDTHGHEVGDQVLQAIAQVLLAQRRTTDRVARLGGEELALLLPQTDAVGAAEVAERCRRAIEAAVIRTPAGSVRVTASFGVAVYRARSQASDRLFERADRALYAAKHGGRNRVEVAADE